jgi:hypothetical protein
MGPPSRGERRQGQDLACPIEGTVSPRGEVEIRHTGAGNFHPNMMENGARFQLTLTGKRMGGSYDKPGSAVRPTSS